MQATLIENDGNGRVAYDSLILSDPKALSALSSKLALKIVKTLAEAPISAIDISRKLKIHEQKVYYHTKKLEKAGIIYTISTEKRHGMTAKIYSVVSPVIAAKLHDRGMKIKDDDTFQMPVNISEFFSPFVTDGKLNAKIIIGDPSPHGKYNIGGTEGSHTIDLMLLIGRFLKSLEKANYKLDTEIRDHELKDNLILIGNNKTNAIIDKINSHLPLYFDLEKNSIMSKSTGKSYKDDRCGLIVKYPNPFNKDKMILVIGGIRTRGIRSAIISIFKLLDNGLNFSNKGNFNFVVQGFDKDSDMIIDDAVILEQ
ncbi:MAG: winged helix-turn-helix transcriptional regulator [Candidatus Aenigmarchaeota archaeon]|nr:winged helix-turn-helix transcriptional regulator [Candidatus Aenigmarchaeota archaeon]